MAGRPAAPELFCKGKTMKNMSCKDLGGMDCDFVASTNSPDEVKEKMYSHAAESHADVLKSMSEQDKSNINAKIDSLLA